MYLGSLKLNSRHGINTFYMCLIAHYIMICKVVEVAGFCNITVSTAEQAVSSVTTQQQCHLLDCKQSHDQNTFIIQMITLERRSQLHGLAALATVSTAQEDSDHGTLLNVVEETESSISFLNGIDS